MQRRQTDVCKPAPSTRPRINMYPPRDELRPRLPKQITRQTVSKTLLKTCAGPLDHSPLAGASIAITDLVKQCCVCKSLNLLKRTTAHVCRHLRDAHISKIKYHSALEAQLPTRTLAAWLSTLTIRNMMGVKYVGPREAAITGHI